MAVAKEFEYCNACPRKCNVARTHGSVGVCGTPEHFLIARIAPHMWEEPSISGERGSGTVFFSGCNLKCVFCQNRNISHCASGEMMHEEELEEKILELVERERVHNINFVTPTHYTLQLIHLIEKLRLRAGVPIVWNSSGYEDSDILSKLDGLVDIYLPDFKYASSELSKKYSGTADYPIVASRALREMYRQVGRAEFGEDGMMRRGLIVRHLVLPGERKNSLEVLRLLSKLVPKEDIRLSLMSQYTPDFALDCEYTNLHRRVTTFEYRSVLDEAVSLEFCGYFQDKSSATARYTPEF